MARSKENTRRFRRQTVRILVDYHAPDGIRCDYATTLGAGGLFIATEEPLEIGATIKLRFRLAGGEALHEIEGNVVWIRAEAGEQMHTPGMAVQFTDPIEIARLARELGDFDGEVATASS